MSAIGRMGAALAVLINLGCAATAHDIYTDLHSGFDSQTGEQTFRRDVGQLCCEGSGPQADCEALAEYRVAPNGNFLIHSNRYGVDVEIAPSKVAYTGVAGSEAPVHWCGVPRSRFVYYGGIPPSPDNPDPMSYTYCAFVVPSGS